LVLLKEYFKFQVSSFKFKTLKLCILATCILYLASPAFAAEKVYLINIEGMHCKMCVFRVTKSLKKLKEVREVEVSLDDGTATVLLNDGVDVKPEVLEEAVKESGYNPTGIKELK